MRNIRTIEEALNLFEKNSIIYGNTFISGNYKVCNKAYDIIMKCGDFLKEEEKVDFLLPFLEHEKVSIKYVSACFFTTIIYKKRL